MNSTVWFRFLVRLAAAIALPLGLAGAPAGAASRPEKPSKSDRAEVGRGDGQKADYVLQPFDLIRVQVLGEDDLNKLGEVRVSQEFSVTLPLIGQVDLRGRTVRQAEQLIRDRYDRDYFVNPQVSVTVLKYVERFVRVFGQVNKPGNVAFPQEEGLTLTEAISRAEGFTRLADQKKVTLTRTFGDGTTETQIVNLADLLKGSASDIPLQPNDMINVAERIL